jgi:hypothetical protein
MCCINTSGRNSVGGRSVRGDDERANIKDVLALMTCTS